MKTKHLKPLVEAMLNDSIILKLIIELWNAETPHFGGDGPHRYDGKATECAYCFRPKDWTKINAGYYTNELLYGDDTKSDKFRIAIAKARGE